jgi:hypothetical protein
MLLSMMAAGAASISFSPRAIGVCSGIVSSTTAFFWTWANWSGRLPEPPMQAVSTQEEREVKAEPPVGA